MLQPDLLQGHKVLCQLAASLEDGGIGTLRQGTPCSAPDHPVYTLLPAPPLIFLLGLGFKLVVLLPLFKFCLLQGLLLLEASLLSPWLERTPLPPRLFLCSHAAASLLV